MESIAPKSIATSKGHITSPSTTIFAPAAAVTDEKGAGLRFSAEKPFIFGATHYTPYALEETKHDDELVPDADTHVYLDAGMDIAGQKSAYCTALEPERVWDDTHIDFAVRIEPSKSL